MRKLAVILSLTILYLLQPSCSIVKKMVHKKVLQQDTITTASGLKYIILKKLSHNEPLAKSGEVVTVHYTGYFGDGTVFDSSVKRGQPIKFTLGIGQVIKGWDEGLQLMGTGDHFKLIVPYQLAYGEKGKGKIPPKTDLIFDVEMIYHQPEIVVQPFTTAGFDTLTTEQGLQIIKTKTTHLQQVKQGDKVSVHYSGYLEDGTMFDSSVKRDQAIDFRVGVGQVIKGWDQALLKMRKGEKARLIIPSHLAYGSRGAGSLIPPDATLIFDIYLIDIR